MNILDGDANIFEDDLLAEPIKQESDNILNALSTQQHASCLPHGGPQPCDNVPSQGLSILQQTLQQPEQQIQVSSFPSFNVSPLLTENTALKKEQFNILNNLSASKHTELAQQLFAPLSPSTIKQEPAKIHVSTTVHSNGVAKPQSPAFVPVAPATPQTHKIIVSSTLPVAQSTPAPATSTPASAKPQQIIINSVPQQQPRVTSQPKLTTNDIIMLSQQLNTQQLQVSRVLIILPINYIVRVTKSGFERSKLAIL